MRLEGIIPFGVVATTSMRHGTEQVLEPDAFGPVGDLLGDIFLLLGFDYGAALASTGSGSLSVRVTPEGIHWSTTRLAKTAAEADLAVRLRAGLIGGTLPGFIEDDVVEEVVNAKPVRVVRRARLCEINLVARAPGDGSTVLVRRRRT